jgi:hypothetical protein
MQIDDLIKIVNKKPPFKLLDNARADSEPLAVLHSPERLAARSSNPPHMSSA